MKFTLSKTGNIAKIGVFTLILRLFIALPVYAASLPTPEWVNGKIASTVATPAVKAEEKPVFESVELASVMGNALVASNIPETIETNPIRYGTSRFRVQVGTTFDLTVTAYSSTVDQCDSDPFTTASGTTVHDGTVAANCLPFGTHVTFPNYSGDKVYTIEDRTNAKYSSRADIWMVSREAALHFGKRHLKMVVVE
jgi:3D (Asp-Asp-Asp) domain-containing protein